MTRWSIALSMLCCNVDAADLRQDVLQAIFPSMEIVATTRHRPDSLRYPDAFAHEVIYQVNGPAINEIERCASGRLSRSREVQLQVFPWPRTRADLVAVVQYRFIGVSPAGSCRSIGLVIHLSQRRQAIEVLERHLVEPMHHSMFAGVRLL